MCAALRWSIHETYAFLLILHPKSCVANLYVAKTQFKVVYSYVSHLEVAQIKLYIYIIMSCYIIRIKQFDRFILNLFVSLVRYTLSLFYTFIFLYQYNIMNNNYLLARLFKKTRAIMTLASNLAVKVTRSKSI